MSMAATDDKVIETVVMRRVFWRLMPFLLFAYLICYIRSEAGSFPLALLPIAVLSSAGPRLGSGRRRVIGRRPRHGPSGGSGPAPLGALSRHGPMTGGDALSGWHRQVAGVRARISSSRLANG